MNEAMRLKRKIGVNFCLFAFFFSVSITLGLSAPSQWGLGFDVFDGLNKYILAKPVCDNRNTPYYGSSAQGFQKYRCESIDCRTRLTDRIPDAKKGECNPYATTVGYLYEQEQLPKILSCTDISVKLNNTKHNIAFDDCYRIVVSAFSFTHPKPVFFVFLIAAIVLFVGSFLILIDAMKDRKELKELQMGDDIPLVST
jgi:hypothetical protein